MLRLHKHLLHDFTEPALVQWQWQHVLLELTWYGACLGLKSIGKAREARCGYRVARSMLVQAVQARH